MGQNTGRQIKHNRMALCIAKLTTLCLELLETLAFKSAMAGSNLEVISILARVPSGRREERPPV